MPRKSRAKPKGSYVSLFFPVTQIEHYVGFSINHEPERTGLYHRKSFHFEAFGTTVDYATLPEKPIQLSVYAQENLILNESELRKAVEARLDWSTDTCAAREREKKEIARQLEPTTIGFMELRKGTLAGAVWLESDVWQSAFNLALSKQSLYVNLSGKTFERPSYIQITHFALTNRHDV